MFPTYTVGGYQSWWALNWTYTVYRLSGKQHPENNSSPFFSFSRVPFKEHPSEHQKDASSYEAKPNSSDNEPDYKPSIISKVQAFEQGSTKDSGEGEQDKRQEPKREPKKLKPVQFNSTATQPDDSERRKREAEIRPLGGVVKVSSHINSFPSIYIFSRRNVDSLTE